MTPNEHLTKVKLHSDTLKGLQLRWSQFDEDLCGVANTKAQSWYISGLLLPDSINK
jgi:hypothetical protein